MISAFRSSDFQISGSAISSHKNIQVTLSNLIYVDASNLKPRIQNRIRRMAAFANPVFYKNQAMGLSNFANGRYIYLGQDENDYIGIPRGL